MWSGGTDGLLVVSESSVPSYLLNLENSNITRAAETWSKDVSTIHNRTVSTLSGTLELSDE